MTQLVLAPSALEAQHPRLPLLVPLALAVLFFVATHNLHASRAWQTTVDADITALVSRVAEGNALRQVGFLLLGLLGAVALMLPPWRRFVPRPMVLLPLLLLFAWAALSLGWSATPGLTFKRLVVLGCLFTAAMALVKHHTLEQIVQVAFVTSGLLLAAGFLAELALAPAFPGLAAYRFAGTLHPNHAALNASLLLLSSLALSHRGRVFLLVAAAAFGVLLLTRSRTALAGTLAALAVLAALRLSPGRLKWPLLLAGFTLPVGLTLLAMDALPPVWEALLLGRQESDVRTLTGRTDIWAFALSHLHDPGRWLTGYGYDSFWSADRTAAVSAVVGFKISEGHSLYIDGVLELGLIGVALQALCVLGAAAVYCRTAWRDAGSVGAASAFAVALLVMAAVHGLAESALNDAHLPTFFAICVIAHAALPTACKEYP